jgi:hypothetical protein
MLEEIDMEKPYRIYTTWKNKTFKILKNLLQLIWFKYHDWCDKLYFSGENTLLLGSYSKNIPQYFK